MYKIWTTTRPLGVNYKTFTNKYIIFRFKNKVWKVGMLLKIRGCINLLFLIIKIHLRKYALI
jgi:hypothetical protein